MKLRPYVWHSGTGTLIDVRECKVIYLTAKEAKEIGEDDSLIPADVNEFQLVVDRAGGAAIE